MMRNLRFAGRLRLACVLALLGAVLPARAEEAAPTGPPQVPGDDIFGFTSQTDTGAVGDRSIAFETSSAFSRAAGRYWFSTLKTEFAITPAENIYWAVSPFVTYAHASAVPGLGDIDRTAFDGLSTELLWRFMPRNEYGVAMTFSVEPRWARVDGNAGISVESYSAEFKLFVDAVIVPDKLFWALNLNIAPGVQKLTGSGNPYVNGTGTNVSTAFSYQVNERLFIGAEARYLGAFDGAFLNRTLGTALFAGPVILWKPDDKSFVNLSWTPQLVGWGRNDPSGLDLVNFPRHQLRVKYALTF